MTMTVEFPTNDVKEEELGYWKQFAATTRCVRCSGLMVVEPCIDFPVWRCVQCGEVIDPVILRNRRHN